MARNDSRSFLFPTVLEGMARGELDFDHGQFAVVLVNDKFRARASRYKYYLDLTEEVEGLGYIKGGSPVEVSVQHEGEDLNVVLGGADWPRSTLTARGAVYYAQSSGLLIAYIGFSGDVVSTFGRFRLTSSVIVFHNSED